ncbi:amidohydrolase [Mesoterricola silvestris]|uniref:Amidohydrolase n=1 Tax=Mesoterricola silvestris TaxID=2927979 RepID=A0AA48H7B6_9BACT|nr:amidohydrolase [Mesoterricola silvestris]BDU73113.1 amidohydrolase [Mesoterricola silvestris]
MPVHALPPPPAIQVLLGADVWSGDGEPRSGQALALRGARILAAGPAAEILGKYPAARRVELPGGTLLPGLIEGHAHVLGLGQQGLRADLALAPSLPAALDRVKTWAGSHGGWIEGRGWDQNLWPSKTFPTARDLDAVTGDRPAALERVDGHALWVNSAALKAAGITRGTQDPAGGSILRDAAGEPTGILVDGAMDLLLKVRPAPSPAALEAALAAGLARLRSLGFTSVADMGVDHPTLDAYRRLARAGKLPIRVFVYLAHDTRLMLQELRRARNPKPGFLQVQGVKFYLDGALGSRGARLLEPYADAPTSGIWTTDPARVAADVKATQRAGYQPAIHAIGDAANRKALDILERLPRRAALPPRIEHAQIVTAEDAARFGPLGVVASIQPVHCADDHAWTPARLGPARVEEAFPWRSFLKGGALLALGSDAPVADPNPFVGIVSAETRQDAALDPPGGFLPAQRLTRAEALRGYTAGNARALGLPDLGVLKAGAVADLLWVQAPLATLPSAELRKLKPGRLWVNGIECTEKP